MRRIFLITLAVIIIAGAFAACSNNSDAGTNAVPDVNGYVPIGSVLFEWDTYKIYSGYGNSDESTENKVSDTEDSAHTSNTKNNVTGFGLFDCSEEKPRFIADVPGLELFAVNQEYGYFYTLEISYGKNHESTDSNGYRVRKYNYTLHCYSLNNAYGSARTDNSALQWSKTVYSIDRIDNMLWWDDTALYVRTEREYLDEMPEIPCYRNAFAISLTDAGIEEINESNIPYTVSDIDFEKIEAKIRDSCTAQDGVIGTAGFADCEITANGGLRELNLPLYIYKGRKDYNDYWYLCEAEIHFTPLGAIVQSSDYVDNEKPFYESNSYEEYAVNKTDPLENWGLNDLSQTLNITKRFCENAQDIIAYAQKKPLFYNLFFNRYPADNNSSGNDGLGRIDKYKESIENKTLQSLYLSETGVRKIQTFDATTGQYQFFILLPQYPKGTVDTNDIYTEDIPILQQTDCAYPIQIEISTEQ